MRYNPATDRAISIDEIAAQCKAAILKADAQRAIAFEPFYDEVLKFARWEDDVLTVEPSAHMIFRMDDDGILRLAAPALCAA